MDVTHEYNIIMAQISKTFTVCFTVTEVQGSWFRQKGDEGQAHPEVPQNPKGIKTMNE